MGGTLVYDAARDAAGGLSIGMIATACIVVGFVLMAVPTVRTMRRQPERRGRGVALLAFMAVFGLAVVVGLPMLAGTAADGTASGDAAAQTIEGVVGPVSPTLLTVGGMRVMVSCADTVRCPGVKPGEQARVAYVDDSGPVTDALAKKIWRLPQ